MSKSTKTASRTASGKKARAKAMTPAGSAKIGGVIIRIAKPRASTKKAQTIRKAVQDFYAARRA